MFSDLSAYLSAELEMPLACLFKVRATSLVCLKYDVVMPSSPRQSPAVLGAVQAGATVLAHGSF